MTSTNAPAMGFAFGFEMVGIGPAKTLGPARGSAWRISALSCIMSLSPALSVCLCVCVSVCLCVCVSVCLSLWLVVSRRCVPAWRYLRSVELWHLQLLRRSAPAASRPLVGSVDSAARRPVARPPGSPPTRRYDARRLPTRKLARSRAHRVAIARRSASCRRPAAGWCGPLGHLLPHDIRIDADATVGRRS